ncbi:unnamed protein product [Parnassius mnemosyne]|uniref:Uncharacterized protein n=1 Tax=Parnassius mnemosyne TaxID=213953 RepID=A0AAV1KFI3_9NEOP
MGSGASGFAAESPGTDLRLPTTGLRFTVNQLRSLNSYFDTLYEEDQKNRMSIEMECLVESIVQRIVDGAGQKDPRFRCSHLIALHREKKMRSRSLEYIVTLDSLPVLNADSEDCRLQDGPVGYGKIRLTGREADKWAEFLTPSGYLCRDKVVERWVQAAARSARARGGGTERVHCARAAAHARPYRYCYLQRVSPQTRTEHRLAIVEGAAWVMVRVGVGGVDAGGVGGAGEVEAKLMLAARVGGSARAAYTGAVPLTHPLALLHYTAAQGGYYAAAVGPPTSTACNERGILWQLWHPSLEAALDSHCSDLSTVARVAGALNATIDRMREGSYQGSIQLLSRYLASCAFRARLLHCGSYDKCLARFCAHAHRSHHLLLTLDSLVRVCERGGRAGLVFPLERAGLARRGCRSADWSHDAACIRSCLSHLHALAGNEAIPPTPSESLETALFCRWERLNKESKGSLTSHSYSRRQLRYLCRVARELINYKKLLVYEDQSTFRANLIQATSEQLEPIEDLIHILAIVLDQARDAYLNNFQAKSVGEFDRELTVYRSKKWNKLKDYYDASSACLIDAVRRDPELRREDLKDETNLMKNVLLWLHKGAKEDKKYLSPVLKPYLDGLFNVSMENSWFLEDFDASRCEMEYEGLGEYCMGVHNGEIEPCMGLLDAAKKFTWAKAMVDFLDRYRHIEFRLVFPTGEGFAVSYAVKLPSRREHSSARILTLSRRDKAEAKIRLATRCVLGAFNSALVGDRSLNGRHIGRHESSEEILRNVKSGNFWRNNTKPDIIPVNSHQDVSSLDTIPRVVRRSRRNRPATSYGFPEITITDQSDTKTLRRKYHTLRSLVYTEPVENIKELKRRPRSAGSTVKNKDAMSRPSILETLDFINSVKDALYVEESGTSDAEDMAWSWCDEWVAGRAAPLGVLAARGGALHLALADLVPALLQRARFTILQELCSFLGESSEGALFALHRLARAARSRSSERATNSWKLPEASVIEKEAPQKYKSRPLDYVSGDEAPQPPPLPRHASKSKQITKLYPDYVPSKRLQELEHDLNKLEHAKTRLTLDQNLNYPLNNCTGIINPIYDIKMPKDKFAVKRTKSLGRTYSSRHLGLEITRYNLTLGPKAGKKTNDVVTAMNGTTGETGLDFKSNFFHRYASDNVVGDSYKISRVTVD